MYKRHINPILSRFFYISSVILFGLLGGLCTKSVAQSAPDSVWSFSKIRMDANADDTLDYLGRNVTITGIANIQTGLLHEHYLQAFVQNDSAGMSIFAEKIRQPFKPGDSLVVKGKIQRYDNLVEVKVDSYKVYPGAAEVPTTKPLDKAVSHPQKYLGMIVGGKGKIVEKGTISNGKYLRLLLPDTANTMILIYVSNFHHLYKKFAFDVLSVGDRISVKGIMMGYDPAFPKDQIYRVFLRTPDDLGYVDLPRYYLFLMIGGLLLLSLLVIGVIILLRRQVNRETSEIQKSLNEKEVLLREIHHRVKNSLSIVSGLIGMQMESTDSSEAQEVLQDSQSRIQSMAMIHQKLYETESLSDIKLDNYLEELVETIHSTFTDYNETVDLRFDLDRVELDIDKVIPCGLLINELIVNAFKHAFGEGEQGILEVKLCKKNGDISLTVADNGPGVPEDFNLDNSTSLGVMLISTFAEQLEAKTDVQNKEGAVFTFTFSKN